MDILGADVRRVSNFSRVVTEQEQGEMLSIEDLLDFSNDDVMGPIDSSESHGTTVASSNFPSGNESRVTSSFGATPERLMKQHQTITLFDGGEGASADLYVPCDDLAELEWLSNFVEESFSSADGAVLQNVLVHDEKVQKGEDNKQLGGNPASVFDHQRRGTHDSDSRHVGSSSSSSSIGGDAQLILTPNQLRTSRPARARSKRRRSEACFWNTRILSIVDDCKILEASSTSELTDRQRFSSASSSSDSEGASTLRYGCPVDFCMHEAKKVTVSNVTLKFGTRKEVALGVVKGSQLVGGVGDRKCLHCGSQRTPQWRAGPMGPKTLCNACGVRYKSGRLLPEYRPAASPTFMESIHSNSHRRVLEMRKQRADTPFGSDHADQIGVCST